MQLWSGKRRSLLGFFLQTLKIFLHWIYDDDLVGGLRFVIKENNDIDFYFKIADKNLRGILDIA